MAAISMTALVGGMALSAEAGVWYSHQRDLQSIADSAAYGSAFYLQPKNTDSQSSVDTEARALVSANGLASTQENTSVTFPSNNKVTVLLTDETDRMLSSLFSKDKITIRAQASAQVSREEVEACIVAMNELQVGVKVNGKAELNLTGCSLTSNTSAEFVDAVDTTQKAIINAECIYVVTTADISDGSTINCAPVQKYQQISSAVTDPYADRGEFDPDAYCASKPDADLASYPSGTVIYPGCYRNQVSPSGDMTLMPGLYVFFTGFSATSSGSVTANGVTMMAAGAASVTLSGQGTMRLTPPTHADAVADPELEPFVGIAIWGDTRAGQGTGAHNFTGGANLEVEGVIYAKNGSFKIAGSAGAASDCLQVVAGTVHIAGQATFASTCAGRDYDLGGADVGELTVTLVD